MNKRVLKVLEYDKITERLTAECCSQLTRDKAAKLQPGSDLRIIREELEGIEEGTAVLFKKGAPPLGNFYDVSGLAHLCSKGGSLTMKQLLEVAYNLNSAEKTSVFLANDLPELPRIEGLSSAITVLRNLREEIERCILSEDEMADSASPELRRIRRQIVLQNEAIKTKIQHIVNSSANQAFIQDAIVTQRQGRYVIPVKQEHKAQIAGIVHDQSSSGATLFIEPQAIVNMNNELRELELAEQQEVVRILKELSAWVGEEELAIRGNQDILLKLDYLFAKAKLALAMNASKPIMLEEGELNLKKARHPLIDKKKVVPIDIRLGGDFDTLVVTGPNTGGKTVTLKTAGLLCLMAQSGLFIPAAERSAVPIFQEVFADIGDEQSIEQSLSTFSSHMTNIVGIIKNAGPGSLVLLDELGAGTDPSEGAALAISILDHLYDAGAKTLATTHYTELKKYAVSKSGVQNASMEFDVETLSPTYHLTIGVPGKSNAFEISRKLGLSDDIISTANDLMESGDLAFEDVLTHIEEDRKQAEDAKAEAEEIKRQMLEQKARMDDLEKRFAAQKERLMEDAKLEAAEVVDEARAEIARLQKEIAEARADEDNKALNRKMEESKKALLERKNKYAAKKKEKVNDEAPDAEDIVPGVRVKVLSLGEKGEVLTYPGDGGDFIVQIGQIKLNTNLSQVVLVQENRTEKERQKIKYSRMKPSTPKSVPMSVNVVGKNLDDALIVVDKYLDDAFLAGFSPVTIIHGRGAGILRQGIQSMLKKDKRVDSFRKGEYKEGGDGVTVVNLKK